MEQLTYFDGGKWRLKIGDTEYSGKAVDRLAAYEDTGLEPCDYSAMAHALEQAERAREDLTEMIRQIGATGLDRLRELAQADKEGISPCTFCRFNPPSSGDGKPCCMCPAEAALRRKQDEKRRRLRMIFYAGVNFFLAALNVYFGLKGMGIPP